MNNNIYNNNKQKEEKNKINLNMSAYLMLLQMTK